MRFEILIIFIINGFVGIGYSLIATLFPILGKQINLTKNLIPRKIYSIKIIINIIIKNEILKKEIKIIIKKIILILKKKMILIM